MSQLPEGPGCTGLGPTPRQAIDSELHCKGCTEEPKG